MLARGKGYHRRCFKCVQCNKTLDSTLHCDGPDKDIYCRGCYAPKFGTRGYGQLNGLMSDIQDCERQSWGQLNRCGGQSEDGCPRCGYIVFAAEQMKSKNSIWHKLCFYCSGCRKYLDSTNLNDGPDGNIYCRSCYGKNYGPKGVGYGIGAGTLTMA
ncbi:GL11663 [Drosophila persimilis]|uniref:GL11663 n=1 Tax=Drosophila persimilis TaxID=7234 RepID=B4GCR2_DROPE|nr:GL11663 [Drosophila persimilis]